MKQRRMRLAALATEAVTAPAIGAWAGLSLDKRYGWFPWATLLGLVLGGALAVKLFMMMGKTDGTDDNDK